MTMHLVRGMTSLNTKKNKKRKLTLGKISKYQEEMFAHNKSMRRKGLHDLQMDLQEFIDYCHGDWKPKPKSTEPQKSVFSRNDPWRREPEHIPSLSNNISGVAPVKEAQKYTGTLIKGIATMHKSNAVPIIDKQQAKDIANMRR